MACRTAGKIVAPAALDGMAHTGSVLGAAVLHHMDQRKRRLAFGQIVADMLAGIGLVARIVEDVIDQLEGGADVHAERRQPLFNLRATPARMPPSRVAASNSLAVL
jgi:hypothetical protein